MGGRPSGCATPTFIVVEAWNEPELDSLLLGHYEKLGRLCVHELDGRHWHDVLYRRIKVGSQRYARKTA
jgi:hypothetical protein